MLSEGSVAFQDPPASGSRCLHYLILPYLRTICYEVMQTKGGSYQALSKVIWTFSLPSSELNKTVSLYFTSTLYQLFCYYDKELTKTWDKQSYIVAQLFLPSSLLDCTSWKL